MPEIVNLAAILYMQVDNLKLKILLGIRANRVRHTLIMLKSQVPNVCSKMLLGFYRSCFSKKSSSLYHTRDVVKEILFYSSLIAILGGWAIRNSALTKKLTDEFCLFLQT